MLQFFDHFGIPVQMRVSKDLKHKTSFGGFITIVVGILMFVYSYVILNSCLSYLNPNIVSQDYLVKQPEEVVFTPQLYTFAMGIQDKSLKHFIDESIYYLDVSLLETTKFLNNETNQYEQQTVSQAVQMVPCTQQHFQVNETQSFFQTLNYSNIYCLPLDFQLKLEGQFGALKYKRLNIQVKSCIQNCQDESVIKQVLSDVAFQLYYVNYIISPTNLKEPFIPIAQNTFWQSGYSYFKNINVYFRKNTIRTDQGLIRQDFQNEYRMMYSFDRETVVTKKDNKMYEFFIGLEKNKQSECIRTYMKILSATSQIGGIFNILLILGSIICLPVQKISLYYRLIDSLFNFKEKREEIKFQPNGPSESKVMSQKLINSIQQQQSRKNNQDLINQELDFILNKPQHHYQNRRSNQRSPRQTSNFEITNILNSQVKHQNKIENEDSCKVPHQFLVDIVSQKAIQIDKSQNLKQSSQQSEYQIHSPTHNFIKQGANLFTFLFEKSKNIKINISKMVKSQIKFKSIQKKPEHKMIDYSIKQLQEFLDIRFIMKKLLDIEKLKYLLLNPNQIKLFESIQKPTLYLEDFQNDQKSSQTEIIPSESEGNCLEQQKDDKISSTFLSFFQGKHKNESNLEKEAEKAFKEVYQDKQSLSIIDRRLLKMLIPGISEQEQDESINHFVSDKQFIQHPLIQMSPRTKSSGDHFQNFLLSDEVKTSQPSPNNKLLQYSSQDQQTVQTFFLSKNKQ